MDKCTINDIAINIGSGITPLRSNNEFWNSPDYPWLKTEQLGSFQIYDTSEYISQTALNQTSIKLWPPKTISVAMYGEGKTRGNVSIIMREMTTNQACCNIIVNSDLADYRYVYYWLKNNYEQLRVLSSGVRKNLNSDDIKSFPIVLPDLPIQAQISNVLYALDKKIELNNHIISELEDMAKIIYDYWFVQFDFPNVEGKPYRSSGGEMVWNEQLKRNIPKGWTAATLNSIVQIDNVSFNPSQYGDRIIEHYSIPAYDDGLYPVFEPASNIGSGKYLITKDDILVSKLNPQFKRIWNPYCITELSVCSTEFIPYSCHNKSIRPFCYAILNSDGFHGYMKQNASSSTGSRKRLTPDDTLRYAFVMPEDSVIRKFIIWYSPMLSNIKNSLLEKQELTKLRDWLLPMLMNGQITVD